MAANTKVYMEQGGDKQVVDDGGTQEVKSGGTVDIKSGGKITATGIPATLDDIAAEEGELTTADRTEINKALAYIRGLGDISES